jgi:hypothetical protein
MTSGEGDQGISCSLSFQGIRSYERVGAGEGRDGEGGAGQGDDDDEEQANGADSRWLLLSPIVSW